MGEPVTDKTLARDIAEEMSRRQEEQANDAARSLVFGAAGERTLQYLLDELHAHRGPSWSAGYTRDQKRYRRFWLQHVGKDTPLHKVNRMPLEAMVQKEAEKKDWSPRTQRALIRYLKDAFTFGRERLKILEERHDLSAIQMPAADPQKRFYSDAEAPKLVSHLGKVDPRAGLVGEAYLQAGRRVSATRNLRVDDVTLTELESERGKIRAAVVTWGRKTDKARKTSAAPLTGPAVDLIEELLQKPLVQSSGLLLPHGDLDEPNEDAKPVRLEVLNTWLHEAEAEAGIPHVKNRGYHGLKHRFATKAGSDRRMASLLSGTTEEVIQHHYDTKDDVDLVAMAEFTLDVRRGK